HPGIRETIRNHGWRTRNHPQRRAEAALGNRASGRARPSHSDSRRFPFVGRHTNGRANSQPPPWRDAGTNHHSHRSSHFDGAGGGPDRRPEGWRVDRARHARGTVDAAGVLRRFVSKAVAGRRARTGMSNIHEEEALGKAYDSRLMKRLLQYMAPYKWQVVFALALVAVVTPLELAPPALF